MQQQQQPVRMIAVKSSKAWIAFWCSFPLSAVVGLVGLTWNAGEIPLRLALFFTVIAGVIVAAYASNYVEFLCQEHSIVVNKPYSLLPFSRHTELHLVNIRRVSLWTVRGRSFQFMKHKDAPASFLNTLWSVRFMGLYKAELRVFADYLHRQGVETSGF